MSQLPGIQFGSGLVYATPTTGNLPVNPTPQQVGIIQDISLDIGGDIKELYGQYQWAVDSAVGKRSIKGTFNFAQITNAFLNQAYFSDVVTTGVIETANNELHTIPATPFTVTIAPPGSGVFLADLGVVSAVTGLPLEKIATGTPTATQYTVNVTTGAYLFAAGSTGTGVFISYTYTNTATGTTLTVGNHLMGFGSVLSVMVPFPYDGGAMGVLMPNVRLGKISLKTSLDDYSKFSSDFSAFAGAGQNPISFFNLG